MGTHKNPWDNVPIEVLIEEERRKRLKKQESDRPRINILPPSLTPPPYEERPAKEDEYLIDFSLQ